MANPSLGSALAWQTQRPALALVVVPAADALQPGLVGGLETLALQVGWVFLEPTWLLVATLRPHWCPAPMSAAGKVGGQALVASLWVVFRQVCLETVL